MHALAHPLQSRWDLGCSGHEEHGRTRRRRGFLHEFTDSTAAQDNLCERTIPGQRLFEKCCALGKFGVRCIHFCNRRAIAFERAGILDGYRGMSCEGGQQRNFLVAESTLLTLARAEGTQDLAVQSQRNGQQAAHVLGPCCVVGRSDMCKRGIVSVVGRPSRRRVLDHATDQTFAEGNREAEQLGGVRTARDFDDQDVVVNESKVRKVDAE